MGKKKIEKAIRKARKEQKKQAKRREKKSGQGTTSLSLIDLQQIWEQEGQYKVEKVGPTVYRHTWEFVPGQGPIWPDTSPYWTQRRQELERQEGLGE